MKGVQCYELFGGIALKNHTFSFFYFFSVIIVFIYFRFFNVKKTHYLVKNNKIKQCITILNFSVSQPAPGHISLIKLFFFLLLWGPSITDDDDFLFNVEDTT